MEQLSPHLADETKIAWLTDPKQFTYVRERFDLFSFRVRFPMTRYPKNGQIKLLGYSEISLTAKNENDGFYRRIWYLKSNDPYREGNPIEAVKPSTIKARAQSQWGRED